MGKVGDVMTLTKIAKSIWDGMLVAIVALFILEMLGIAITGVQSFLGIMVLFAVIHWHRRRLAELEETVAALQSMFIYIARTTDIFNKFKSPEQLREDAEEKSEDEPIKS